jgi:hypothetical protein
MMRQELTLLLFARAPRAAILAFSEEDPCDSISS